MLEPAAGAEERGEPEPPRTEARRAPSAAPEAPEEVLGVPRGAPADVVERAWRYHRALYEDGALATYSLLEPQERRAARERVDAAYAALRALAGPGDPTPLLDRSPRVPERLPDPVTGPALRAYREARGIELRAIAAASRVPLRTLQDIEDDRLESLPPLVYLRGFLVEYARETGLDPSFTAASYLSRLRK